MQCRPWRWSPKHQLCTRGSRPDTEQQRLNACPQCHLHGGSHPCPEPAGLAFRGPGGQGHTWAVAWGRPQLPPIPCPIDSQRCRPNPRRPRSKPSGRPSTVAVTAQEEGVTRTPGGLSPSTISLFFKFNFIEVLSLCDVLISAVQRRDLWVFVFFCLWFLPGHPVHLPVLYSRALFIWPLYAIVCIC